MLIILYLFTKPDKIKETCIICAPDLVIEILSPSTKFHDKGRKFVKYKEARVQEVWFVDPTEYLVEVVTRKGGLYDLDMYSMGDKLTVGILPELTISIAEIFTETEDN